MNWWRSIAHFGSGLWQGLLNLPGNVKNAATGLWHFTNQVAQGFDYVLSHPLESLSGTVQIIGDLLTGNLRAANQMAGRIEGFVHSTVPQVTRAWVMRLYRQLAAALDATEAQLARLIATTRAAAETYARHQVRLEVRARQRAITAEHGQMMAQVRAALQTVQREAASAYDGHLPGRLDAIDRLAGLLAGRQPELAGLLRLVSRGVLDLLGVEDPLARLALGFVIRRLADNAAIDRPIAALIGELAGPLLGDPRPRDLHGVIADIALRLDALEGWQQTFMADGGPEILQAGQGWASITSLTADSALLAFFGLMTADPAAWAASITDTVAAPVNDAMIAISGLISRL